MSMFKREPNKSGEMVPAGVWLIFGVAAGCGLGGAMGSLVLGVGLGVAVGGAIMLLSRNRKDSQGA